jgi:hypothetical protein
MTNSDTLFATFPDITEIPGPSPIQIRSTDEHNRTNFVTDEGFLAAFYRGDFIYCVRDYFHCETESRYTINSISFHLPSFEIIRCVESTRRLDLLLKGSDWWAVAAIMESSVIVEFGTNSLAQGHELAMRFNLGLAARDVPETTVSFQVWTGEDYPSTRSFSDVTWTSIEKNYPSSTREGLSSLASFKRTKASSDGRIILFHGPPGTGKTWAIRSLLTTWKKWVQAAVVLDPENLLNSPSYLLKIMDQVMNDSTRLVVIEDADEVVEKNGIRGSGLSRLLNATDGMVGASSDIMVLLSTNAHPRSLDTALLRPGRCLATVGFECFPTAEASALLGERGPAESPMTLAEIYRQLGETSLLKSETPILTGQYL